MRLIELRFGHHIVAAAGAVGEHLKFGAADLRARDIERPGGIVERRARAKTVLRELFGALESLLRIDKRCARLRQSFLGGGKCQLAQLPHAGFALSDRALRLDHGGARLAIIELDQYIAGLDGLPFRDRDIRDGPGDLTADIDAKWRLDVPARDDALDEVGADHGVDFDHRTQHERNTKVPDRCQRADDHDNHETLAPKQSHGHAQTSQQCCREGDRSLVFLRGRIKHRRSSNRRREEVLAAGRIRASRCLTKVRSEQDDLNQVGQLAAT